MDRSTIMQEAYVAETRLRMDFASIVGPDSLADSAGGAILIIPAMRSGTLPVVQATQGQQALTQLRSDQLVIFYDSQHGGLIRDTGSGMQLKSLTPHRSQIPPSQTLDGPCATDQRRVGLGAGLGGGPPGDPAGG